VEHPLLALPVLVVLAVAVVEPVAPAAADKDAAALAVLP
jgi:hypothetical protein